MEEIADKIRSNYENSKVVDSKGYRSLALKSTQSLEKSSFYTNRLVLLMRSAMN